MLPIVFIIAAMDYQPIEYSVPKKMLEDAGYTVITASNKAGTAQAADGSTTKVDLTIDHIKPEKYSALFVIGGPGALENLDNPTTYAALKAFAKTGKPYGAICISPRILAHAGVLTGKKATGWDGDGELASIFKKSNVTYVKQPTVTDGTIVTAVGPQAAQAFGKALLDVL